MTTLREARCTWTKVSQYSYRKACGGRVILFAGKPSDHKCVCGKKAEGEKV